MQEFFFIAPSLPVLGALFVFVKRNVSGTIWAVMPGQCCHHIGDRSDPRLALTNDEKGARHAYVRNVNVCATFPTPRIFVPVAVGRGDHDQICILPNALLVTRVHLRCCATWIFQKEQQNNAQCRLSSVVYGRRTVRERDLTIVAASTFTSMLPLIFGGYSMRRYSR